MNSPIIVGSRSSQLALVQVDEVLRLLKKAGHCIEFKQHHFITGGDIDKSTPLTAKSIADDFFTDSLDRAILDGQIDIAIHSAKDLPLHLKKGISIFALTESIGDSESWVSRYAFKDLPHAAKVGTSSTLRQQAIKSLRSDIQIVQIRGTIQERIDLVKAGVVDGIVVATCALKRLGLSSEIKEIFPWEGMPLQGQLAITGKSNNGELKKLFESIDVRRHYGKVTLVGAGPGDGDLITLKGVKALEKAQCVFYDYLVDQNLLRFAPNAEHIYAGKRKGEHSVTQDTLNRQLRDKALNGIHVVRLKGGDPLIFGRGADEITFLKSYHIPVEVIPGVSSATGLPSMLGIPLTARGCSSSVSFISAHGEAEDSHDPTQILDIPKTDTIVFLMGLTKLSVIVNSLRKAGWDSQMPMMIIANGSRPGQQIIKASLKDIESEVRRAHIKPPALIIAGKTLDNYQPLEPKVYLHCGTHPEVYLSMGHIIPWPMLDIKPVIFTAQEKNELAQHFDSVDMVLLTSRFAVEGFLKTILELKSLPTINQKVFAVIGKHTAQTLEEFGLTAQIQSKDPTAIGLFKTLSRLVDLKGKKILFPRSALPNPYLKEALIKEGAEVIEVTIYDNVKQDFRPLPSIFIDGVIFTSPSTVRYFIEDYGKIPSSWDIIAKGSVTAQELTDRGYPCRIVTGD